MWINSTEATTSDFTKMSTVGAKTRSIAPALAVEVVSPNDLAYEIDKNVEEFFAAGTQLVWVINPVIQTVRVYRLNGPGVILRAEDELTGEDVLPGFRCRVGDLFPSSAAARSNN